MSTVEDPIKDLSTNKNDFELPLDNKNCNKNTDFDNEGLGLVMDVRSTTFRNLTEMIPRGYGDMSDVTKKEEEIVSNERSNFDITSSSSPSHNPLEEMKIRNQEKWAQLGYDPEAGRGNMKMSITLSNFKPSAILNCNNNSQNNSINGKNITNSFMELKSNDLNINLLQSSQNQQLSSILDGNESNTNSYSKQVLQSYSMCIKPQKQIKRVNSSNDPSTFIETQSNSDENNESDHLNSSDVNPIPVVKLNTTALLASFRPLEEDLQSPDRTEVLNYFDNSTQNESGTCEENTESSNAPSEFASNSVSDSQTSVSNLNDGEVESTYRNERSSQSQSKKSDTKNNKFFIPNSPSSSNSPTNSSSTSGSYLSENIKKVKTHKHTKEQSQIEYEYSAYDDPSFDYETALKNIPPNLLKIVKYPKTGIVFRAICGKSMLSYPKTVSQYVIADLKIILDKCVSKNMIAECEYVSDIINSIKAEVGESISGKKAKYDEEIFMEAEESHSKRQKYWENQKNIINSEKEVKFQEIELRYQDELENLEMIWNSDKKRAQFNKPSAQLMALRQNIQANLASRRFQEATQLAARAEKLDKIETELAAKRMRQAYSEAVERLKQNFENERKALNRQFESRKASLLAQEEADLKPIENKIQKFNNIKIDDQQLSSQQASAPSADQDALSTANATRRSISVMSKTSGNYGPVIKKPIIKTPKIPMQTNTNLKLPSLNSNPQSI